MGKFEVLDYTGFGNGLFVEGERRYLLFSISIQGLQSACEKLEWIISKKSGLKSQIGSY